MILSSILMGSGIQIVMTGLLADAISANRRISDELLYRVKKIEYDSSHKEEVVNPYLMEDKSA